MDIKQWEDKHLSHFSYAILNEVEKKIVLIDPSRNPSQYIQYAKEKDAVIAGIIETHPHADFVSSHLEISQLFNAPIYVSSLANAAYPHQSFDEGEAIVLGEIKLSALNTPGHSPDSICIVLEHEEKIKAVFTGDTLFIGDCGRPDLREDAADIKTSREELARKMYHSLRNKLSILPAGTIVYPAHGAGTLCGRSLSKAHSSTIGDENQTNWALQPMTETEFIKNLLTDQPFIPAYFPFDVELNREGAVAFGKAISQVKIGVPVESQTQADKLDKDLWIIDARKETEFKRSHLPHTINLMEDGKFETWLGSIILPTEKFYVAVSAAEQLPSVFARVVAIGYESNIEMAFVTEYGTNSTPPLDLDDFKNNEEKYTIIDVRNADEVKENKIFHTSISIPLAELREQMKSIPVNKPIVVHCAGGYRSAAASSMIESGLQNAPLVFDLGENIKKFIRQDTIA